MMAFTKRVIMDGLTFVILAAGEDHRIVNAILDAYDTLADSSPQGLRRVSLRRLLSSVIKEHPILGRALSWAKSLGQSGGRILSPEVRRLINSRRYTEEDISNINVAIDEAMSPDFVIPYNKANYDTEPKPKRGIISRQPVRKDPESDSEYESREPSPPPLRRSVKVSEGLSGWQRLVSELTPQGYSLKEISDIWNRGPEASHKTPIKNPPPEEVATVGEKGPSKRVAKSSKPRTFADRVENNIAKSRTRKRKDASSVAPEPTETLKDPYKDTPNTSNTTLQPSNTDGDDLSEDPNNAIGTSSNQATYHSDEDDTSSDE
jgi:hypothetical protein